MVISFILMPCIIDQVVMCEQKSGVGEITVFPTVVTSCHCCIIANKNCKNITDVTSRHLRASQRLMLAVETKSSIVLVAATI